jgi:hypothetical protein
MSGIPPDAFYVASKPQLSQGDIVQVPTTSLWSLQARGSIDGIPSLPTGSLGKTVAGQIWKVSRTQQNEYLTHSTRNGIGIIVSHDCALDKEFNEYVRQLEGEGLSAEEAIKTAESKSDLDETLLVAPLLFLSEIPRAYHASIDQKIGYFALADLPVLPGERLVANLHQLTTVDHRLIARTIASLSPIAVSRLRFKLAEVFSYRSISSLASLSKLVGQQVIDIQVHDHGSKKKKLSRMTLVLADNSTVQLDISTPDPVDPDEGITRRPGLRPPSSETTTQVRPSRWASLLAFARGMFGRKK